jgi:hypothetical protein
VVQSITLFSDDLSSVKQVRLERLEAVVGRVYEAVLDAGGISTASN